MARYRDPMFDSEKRGHPTLVFMAVVLAVLLAAVAVLNHISNSRARLIEQDVTVSGMPSALEGFRILHISDLCGIRFGENQENLAGAIAGKRYDVVCITGDITGKNGDARALIELIDALPSGVPVYFITGDQDPADLSAAVKAEGGALADYIAQAQAHGAVYLDAPQKITVGDQAVWFSPESLYTYNLEGSERSLNARRAELLAEEATDARDAALAAVDYQLDRMKRIREARADMRAGDTHIALTHYPLGRTALIRLKNDLSDGQTDGVGSISLLLAGHFVGGQWRLPWLNAVYAPPAAGLGTNGWFPGDEGVVGLSYSLGVTQYISPGLGTSDDVPLPAFRLFNAPAVTILRLTTKLVD